MPIFEYLCDDCNETFERLVHRDEQVECPSCKGAHLSKQYSRFGFGGESGKKTYESLPLHGGGGCGCSAGGCGCKN